MAPAKDSTGTACLILNVICARHLWFVVQTAMSSMCVLLRPIRLVLQNVHKPAAVLQPAVQLGQPSAPAAQLQVILSVKQCIDCNAAAFDAVSFYAHEANTTMLRVVLHYCQCISIKRHGRYIL